MLNIQMNVFTAATCFACSAVMAQTTTVVPSPANMSESGFNRSSSGWECARAETWHENQFWRDKRPDTIYVPRTGHRSQPFSKKAMTQCVSRLDIGTAPQRDLLGLVQGYLAADQDAQAAAAAAKLVTSLAAGSAQVKAWALYQLSDIYLNSNEPRLAKAEQIIKQLDAIGTNGAVERMLAHRMFASTARFRDSIPLWERELNAALAASKEIVGDARKEYANEMAGVYLDIADFKGRMNNSQAAIQAIESARAELTPLRNTVVSVLRNKEVPYTMMGTTMSAIQATRWFNNNGITVRPVAGKPALLVFVSHNCGSQCYPGYAVLRRLRAKFENKGLDITLITRTQAYYLSQLVKPEIEMMAIDNYFTKHLNLPVNLAVWLSDLGKREDGQVTVLSAPNDEALRPSDLLAAYIVAPDGKIRLVSLLSRANEAILEDVLASLLAPTS